MTDQRIHSRVMAAISALIQRFGSSETAVMMTLAIVVGIGAGLGTIVFIEMIKFFSGVFFGSGAHVLGFLGTAYVILLPALGGLLVGPLVHFVAPEAKGHGVPEVLAAIAIRGGRIRPVVVIAKALGSAITIGAGGSVGREGPIVQIGSALGSTIGQALKLNERRVVNLVASGAAGGIAATFNAPIAGVMFALEVILGEFGIQTFSTIVISAVTASVVGRIALGDSPAFAVPAYALKSPWELLLYLGLGVASAVGALAFMKVLHFSEDTFNRWKFPPYLKPAVGGLALGLLGFVLPQVFGTGFGTIEGALNGQVGLGLLLVLVLGKILATSLTLGSGSSGGVFAPALFIGAVLGGAYGQLAQLAFPGIVAASGAYAMVGMAAVFAGAARAPITAIVILFEMTQDYRIILPLMFATVISTVLSQWFERESIYTFKLKRRGIDVRAKKDTNLMRGILVQEAMTPITEFSTVTPETPLAELARLFQETGHHGMLVLDTKRELYGVVTLADLERVLTSGGAATVADICTTAVLTAFADETLDDALRHFGALDVGRIPVVDRRHPRRVLGVLRRSDIVQAYSHALVDKNKAEHHIERLRMESRIGATLVQVGLRTGDAAVGRHLRELGLPSDCVIVAIHRGGQVVVPRGDSELLPGDRLTVLTGASTVDSLSKALQEGTTVQDSGSGSHEAPAVDTVEALEEIMVSEVMETNTVTLHESDSLAAAADLFARTRHHGLPVVDGSGGLAGILTVQDLEQAQAETAGSLRSVGDVCTRDLLVTYPDESVGDALRRISGRDVGRLPVVARDDPRRLLGVLRRMDLVRAYDIALTRRAALRHRAHEARLDAATGPLNVEEIVIQPGAACDRRRVREVVWPREVVIASVRRGGQMLIPHGSTLLEAGDVLVVVAEGKAAAEIRRLCGSG